MMTPPRQDAVIRAELHNYAHGGDESKLHALARTAEAAMHDSPPSAFFRFDRSASSHLQLPPLLAPCFAPSVLSIWAWVRLEKAKLSGEVQLVCGFHGAGVGIELVVVDSHLSVRVRTTSGGLSAVLVPRAIEVCRWQLIIVDHQAPPRRIFPFVRPGQSTGTVRVYLDGELACEAALEFPSPTSALRLCSAGCRPPSIGREVSLPAPQSAASTVASDTSDSASNRLCGQLAELLLLPVLTGSTAAAKAMAELSLEPRITMQEAAARCGLKPSVALHPFAFSDVGGSVTASAAQLGAVVEAGGDGPGGFLRNGDRGGGDGGSDEGSAGGCGVLVDCRRDVRDALVGIGGIRIPLLLIGRMMLHRAIGSSLTSGLSVSVRHGRSAKAAGIAESGIEAGREELASLLSMLRALVWRRASMARQLVVYDGAAVLGWLLRLAPADQLGIATLRQLEGLIDVLATIDSHTHADGNGDAPPSKEGGAPAWGAAAAAVRGGRGSVVAAAAAATAAAAAAAPWAAAGGDGVHELLERFLLCTLCDLRIWARASAEVPRHRPPLPPPCPRFRPPLIFGASYCPLRSLGPAQVQLYHLQMLRRLSGITAPACGAPRDYPHDQRRRPLTSGGISPRGSPALRPIAAAAASPLAETHSPPSPPPLSLPQPAIKPSASTAGRTARVARLVRSLLSSRFLIESLRTLYSAHRCTSHNHVHRPQAHSAQHAALAPHAAAASVLAATRTAVSTGTPPLVPGAAATSSRDEVPILRAELSAIRTELIQLAAEMRPSHDEVHVLLSMMTDSRIADSLRVHLVRLLTQWLAPPPATSCGYASDHAAGRADGDPSRRSVEPTSPGRSTNGEGASSRSSSMPSGRSSGATGRGGVRTPGGQRRAANGQITATADRMLRALLSRGGARALLLHLIPSHAPLREAVVSALVAYLRALSLSGRSQREAAGRSGLAAGRDVPTRGAAANAEAAAWLEREIAEVESELARRVGAWAAEPALLSDGLCAAICAIGASAADPHLLSRPRLPAQLVAVLPAATAASQAAVLRALMPYLDEDHSHSHGAANVAALLSHNTTLPRLVHVALTLAAADAPDELGAADARAENAVAASLVPCVNFGEVPSRRPRACHITACPHARRMPPHSCPTNDGMHTSRSHARCVRVHTHGPHT